MIGDTQTLDYTKICDRTYQPNKQIQSIQPGSLGSLGFNSSQYLTVGDENEDDLRPQLLYTKFQRLKNTATKLARVLIIDEVPIISKER